MSCAVLPSFPNLASADSLKQETWCFVFCCDEVKELDRLDLFCYIVVTGELFNVCYENLMNCFVRVKLNQTFVMQ